LDIPHYDMVIGMDWLEEFSPMKVGWARKWMMIPYQNGTMVLQGVLPSAPVCTVLQLMLVEASEIPNEDSVQYSPKIKDLLEVFSDVFADPVGLPPSRSCDHTIPLIPGAQPFSIKPYKYPPALKDEIEKHIKEMLLQGVIRKSSSPFASPVLLVKKKDKSWRFCIDYRYLNAITVKGKYPVPVFDQLMDELAHAKWFSKLDITRYFWKVVRNLKLHFKHTWDTLSSWLWILA